MGARERANTLGKPKCTAARHGRDLSRTFARPSRRLWFLEVFLSARQTTRARCARRLDASAGTERNACDR